MPEISVIMGVYNQRNRRELLDAVNSILNQTFQDFEFIIYNDGSGREATELLREVERLDDRVKLIGTEKNHGLAFSLNACIGIAKGKYIARMDADDISYPNRILIQKQFLDSYSKYAWCGCNTELFDNIGIWGRRDMPPLPGRNDYLCYSPYVHPTVMYRREIFEKNAGYMESKEMLRCEDYEIFMRLECAGLRGANIQQYLFCYREDERSYRRRSMQHRWNEAGCRYRGFKQMGILFPRGWFYVLRPIVGGMVPPEILSVVKRKECALQEEEVLYECIEANERII